MRKIPLNSSSRIIETITCQDEYEAEKLKWILSTNSEEHKPKNIFTISESELIIVLNDESSHSIMISDKESVVRLQRTIHMILFYGKKPMSVLAHRNLVQIIVE